jgi:hypothetical protein
MIEIVAKAQQGTERTSLDVQETPVEFNYKIDDLADISAKRSPHSLRFSMPRSRVNDKFFAHFYNVNLTSGTFSPQVKTDVEVFDGGVVILHGILQLHSVDEANYEVSVLGEIADFFEKIRDLSFQDLFINPNDGTLDTDLDHTLSSANIKSSWSILNDITTGQVGDGVIVYPLSDTALPLGENNDKGFFRDGQFGMGVGNSEILPTTQKPSIQIKWLFGRIAKYAGFSISSNFFNTDHFEKIYMTLATEQSEIVLRDTYGLRVGLNNNISFNFLPVSPPMSNIGTSLLKETGLYYDPDALFTGGAFIAPFTGTYVFKISYKWICTPPPTGTSYTVKSVITGPGGIYGSFPEVYGPQVYYAYSSAFDHYTTTSQVTCSQGDALQFNVISTGQNAPLEFQKDDWGSPGLGTYVELLNYTAEGGLVNVRENFPSMKVGEWVKEISQRFNLVLLTENENPTVLNIEPWNEFVDANTSFEDWSTKVDIDSIKIEPTTAYQKKQIKFTDGEGEDWKNSWWQDNVGWVKGQAIYNNSTPDFVTEEQVIGGKFQPLRLSTIPSDFFNGPTELNNVLVQRFYSQDIGSEGEKTNVSAKPILSYYHGTQLNASNISTIFYLGAQGNQTSFQKYPFFSEFSDSPVVDSSLSLSWGYDYPDNVGSPYIGEGISLNQCFQTYWARFMHTRYSQDSRILTCKAYLTPQDIRDLKWNSEYFLENAWWRVLEVNNYATGGNELCNLKLIKVIQSGNYNTTSECDARPLQSNVNGTISFANNITGLLVTPTRECCEKYGYVWNEDDAVCMLKPTGGGGGNGGDGFEDGLVGGFNGGVGIDPYLADFSPISNTEVVQGTIIERLPFSKGSGITEGGINGSVQNFKMYLTTTDATYTPALTPTGETDMLIGFNSIYLITANIVTVETGGASGVSGRAYSMTYQASVGNIETIAKNIGTTTLINAQGEAGAVRGLSIQQKQTTGNPPFFQVLCQGEVGKDVAWILDVNMVQIRMPFVAAPLPTNDAYWNLTPDELIYLNIASGDTLTWNLA